MYVKPLLSTVETSVATASCCWVGGGVGSASVDSKAFTLQTPSLFIGPVNTGLCGTGPFPTCREPVAPALCVISASFEVVPVSVAGITVSGIGGSIVVSGLP